MTEHVEELPEISPDEAATKDETVSETEHLPEPVNAETAETAAAILSALEDIADSAAAAEPTAEAAPIAESVAGDTQDPESGATLDQTAVDPVAETEVAAASAVDASSAANASGDEPPAAGVAATESAAGTETGTASKAAKAEKPAQADPSKAGKSKTTKPKRAKSKTGKSKTAAPPSAGHVATPIKVEPSATGRRLEVLQAALKSFNEKLPVEGKVIGWNKGGFHVSLDGLGAFCPRSQIEIGNPRHPASYIDETFSFMIAEMDEAGRRVVLNRATLLAEQRKSERIELKKSIKVDAVLEGRVDSLSDFGAFVDLGGGMRGLIHVSQLTHNRVEKPEEAVSVGDKVKVKVLKIENGGKRISLSRKALEPDPWADLESRITHGQTFSAKVMRRTEFGLFAEVEPGIEGLVHSSQLPIGASIDDSKFDPGTTIEGWVREVNADRHRLALTMREIPEGDPWEGLTDRYEEGTMAEGVVEQIARFGFFVTLEPGLTGLLPFSAVTAPAGRRREQAYRVGQELKVVLLELDGRRKRISLGLEGAQAEGSKADFKNFQRQGDTGNTSGLNAMAAAFAKLNSQ